ncbi:hypothetical protein Rhopal_004931-T1 [Rhodotorula paludigena]|uniref:CSD domain-containing protein n=1 Tax=Rhodotorula paludigena TaxID=86838 RepID=A0AAV5GH15_9BASI|nr:hypothetical protein Rhopal_004931-T1 [Rhodotorula paludigena]
MPRARSASCSSPPESPLKGSYPDDDSEQPARPASTPQRRHSLSGSPRPELAELLHVPSSQQQARSDFDRSPQTPVAQPDSLPSASPSGIAIPSAAPPSSGCFQDSISPVVYFDIPGPYAHLAPALPSPAHGHHPFPPQSFGPAGPHSRFPSYHAAPHPAYGSAHAHHLPSPHDAEFAYPSPSPPYGSHLALGPAPPAPPPYGTGQAQVFVDPATGQSVYAHPHAHSHHHPALAHSRSPSLYSTPGCTTPYLATPTGADYPLPPHAAYLHHHHPQHAMHPHLITSPPSSPASSSSPQLLADASFGEPAVVYHHHHHHPQPAAAPTHPYYYVPQQHPHPIPAPQQEARTHHTQPRVTSVGSLKQVLDDGGHVMSRGAAKFFDVAKGFGFIIDDNGESLGADVFVHYTGIDMPRGFRCLAQGERVEYVLTKHSSGRYQALRVTGENGAKLQGLDDERNADSVKRMAERASAAGEHLGGDFARLAASPSAAADGAGKKRKPKVVVGPQGAAAAAVGAGGKQLQQQKGGKPLLGMTGLGLIEV